MRCLFRCFFILHLCAVKVIAHIEDPVFIFQWPVAWKPEKQTKQQPPKIHSNSRIIRKMMMTAPSGRRNGIFSLHSKQFVGFEDEGVHTILAMRSDG